MQDPKPTPTPTYHHTVRATDNGYFVTSANRALDDLRHTPHDGLTGLVWLAHLDGGRMACVAMHPDVARRLAGDLLAAAEATEAIMRAV